LRYLQTLLLLVFLQLSLHAQALTIGNISTIIQSSLQTHLKGQNKNIVKHMYAKTNFKPLWIGKENKKSVEKLLS